MGLFSYIYPVKFGSPDLIVIKYIFIYKYLWYALTVCLFYKYVTFLFQ